MATKSKTSRPSGRRSGRSAGSASDPARGPLDGDLNLARLKALVELLEASSLAELEYEDASVVVRLSRHATIPVLAGPPAPPVPAAHVAGTVPMAAAPAAAPAKVEANVHLVRSPFVGTFYRSPSPDAASFAEIGQTVSRGQTLCIVEAMKLMNEIEAEVSGTVLEILVENGKAVQYGDALFKIAVKS
jgi:acetyl-CoA carboxylase biotin carboxyl carrier protein